MDLIWGNDYPSRWDRLGSVWEHLTHDYYTSLRSPAMFAIQFLCCSCPLNSNLQRHVDRLVRSQEHPDDLLVSGTWFKYQFELVSEQNI